MDREKPIRIEMTDEEWIEARKPKIKFTPQMQERLDRVLLDQHIELKAEKINEPQENKVAKKKPAKVHRKANKTAMASLQKKS